MKTTATQKITVEKPTEEKLKQLNVKSWPIWTKEASTFDWHYDDKETCYILAGEVTVKTNDASVSFKAGDIAESLKGKDGTYSAVKSDRGAEDLFTYKAFVERTVDGDSVPRKTAQEMRAGPSKSICGNGFQSALSGVG